jgi:hypothetical protein
MTKPYSFSSIAHVWVLGAKTTGPSAKRLVFIKSNFYVSETVRIFKCQCDPFSKMFHKGPVAANGACQKWLILFLDIGTSVDGHEKK